MGIASKGGSNFEQILADRAGGFVANVIRVRHSMPNLGTRADIDGANHMYGGYGRTMKQARSEARMFVGQANAARREHGGVPIKIIG